MSANTLKKASLKVKVDKALKLFQDVQAALTTITVDKQYTNIPDPTMRKVIIYRRTLDTQRNPPLLDDFRENLQVLNSAIEEYNNSAKDKLTLPEDATKVLDPLKYGYSDSNDPVFANISETTKAKKDRSAEYFFRKSLVKIHDIVALTDKVSAWINRDDKKEEDKKTNIDGKRNCQHIITYLDKLRTFLETLSKDQAQFKETICENIPKHISHLNKAISQINKVNGAHVQSFPETRYAECGLDSEKRTTLFGDLVSKIIEVKAAQTKLTNTPPNVKGGSRKRALIKRLNRKKKNNV
jgi:hypothetical protein